MNMNYSTLNGYITDGTYFQMGHVRGDETGTGSSVTLDLQFRMATNGIIVNTLVNDNPVITTSAGQFR